MKIVKTSITKPPKICIYGQHGIGKSTFASLAPNPIFIPTEDRLDHLGVTAFELCKSFQAVIDCMDFLIKNDTEYKTVVLDSLDWLEQLIFTHICKEQGAKDMGDLKVFPYQRGYNFAEKVWHDDILPRLQYLNSHKKMMIILLAHCAVKRYNDPTREAYDIYDLDLHKKAASKIHEFCDVIGFADYRIIANDGKAKGTGESVLFLKKKPAFEAKNSYGLPDSIPFGWSNFAEVLYPALNKNKVGNGNLAETKNKKENKKEENNE